MKTRTTTLFALLIGLFALAFVAPVQEYKVDTKASSLHWIGRKVTGEHDGTLKISNGSLQWDGKQLKGGSFDIDMASITNTDLKDADYNKKLVDHLESEDFFATRQYPKATFVITKVTPQAKNEALVKGNLTIKGITKEIEFPATIQAKGNELTATAKILVDRTLYNIKYGSGSFFDNLGDKAIDNEFELNVALVAKAPVAQ
jgi:polyisoprenoid-binding protein YceI